MSPAKNKTTIRVSWYAWIVWSPAQNYSIFLLLSIAFWVLLQRSAQWTAGLFVTLSLASFMLGSLIGFLFSSYDEEAATIGKVRDWIIGGLAGITIIKFRSVQNLLLTFAAGPSPNAYAITVGVSTIYAICGFFAMFLQRELILNILLAAGRRKRGLLEGGKVAGAVARELLSNAPLNLLLGQFSSDNLIDEENKAERDAALIALGSPEISEYLKQAESATKDGLPLDWDVVSKVAALHYYRIYSVAPEKRQEQVNCALDWLRRAWVLFPGHPDFETKFADALNEQGRNEEAIDTLRRLMMNPQAPAYVMQWLSVFLLVKPGHEKESIELSRKYFAVFPSAINTYFNLARAYAGLYNTLSGEAAALADPAIRAQLEVYRLATVDNIRLAIEAQPEDRRHKSKEWVKAGKAYTKFMTMGDFSALLA